jgi:hypothetical protein
MVNENKQFINIFISYAHADRSKKDKFLDLIQKRLKTSKHFNFNLSSDRDILVGEAWYAKIQGMIQSCDFGLLLISSNFLISDFISGEELPKLLDKCLPVAIDIIDFKNQDLKGLEEIQIYRYQDKAFSEYSGTNLTHFVHDLANQIEKRVKSVRPPSSQSSPGPNAKPRQLFPDQAAERKTASGSKIDRDEKQKESTTKRSRSIEFILALKKRSVSLKIILAVLTIIISLPTAILAVIELTQHTRIFPTLKQTQREVQKIEERMSRFTTLSRAPILTGEREYHDPVNSENVMIDTWRDGRLTYRRFFARERLIAQDSFQYDKGTVVGKERIYMDSNQCVFLVDRFTQDGLLTSKRHRPNGEERSTVEYLDNMRSPLPLPQLIFYR